MGPLESELNRRYAEEDAQTLERDIRAVLSTEAGRRLYSRIVQLSGLYAHSVDTRTLALEAGRRNLGLDIRRDVKRVDPALDTRSTEEYDALWSKRQLERIDAAGRDRAGGEPAEMKALLGESPRKRRT